MVRKGIHLAWLRAAPLCIMHSCAAITTDKFSQILKMHTIYGTEMKSVWSFSTLNPISLFFKNGAAAYLFWTETFPFSLICPCSEIVIPVSEKCISFLNTQLKLPNYNLNVSHYLGIWSHLRSIASRLF